MSEVLPPPEAVRAAFDELLKVDAQKATDYLHELGVSSGYIKASDSICWTDESSFGLLECTINRKKPEKDPRAIIRAQEAGLAQQARVRADNSSPQGNNTKAPLCDLCWENEEFPGTPEHPAKPGLRIAAISLGNEQWGLQYSPYAYYPEHCIALSKEHRPMKIDEACFTRLLDFVDVFPHYFIGSNADLPIVGGSILSHDHFQGGRHEFPLMKAPLRREVSLTGMPSVRGGIVRWPASVLRLCSRNSAALVQAATRVLHTWQQYSNDACSITAHTTHAINAPVSHNTLCPIVRKTEDGYCMDLVLRNNRTSAQHPWGIFHPGEELHHIKKENIGLIEIMGRAILPSRLAVELPRVQQTLINAAARNTSLDKLLRCLSDDELTAPHAAWAVEVFQRRAADFLSTEFSQTRPVDFSTNISMGEDDLHPVIRQEVARVFMAILKITGVFKHTTIGEAGWDSFISQLNQDTR